MEQALGKDTKKNCYMLKQRSQMQKIETLIISQEKRKTKNSNWLYFPDLPYKILTIGSSVSRKTNALLNLIRDQPDIGKFIYILRNHTKQSLKC